MLMIVYYIFAVKFNDWCLFRSVTLKKDVTLRDSFTSWTFQGVHMSEAWGMCIAEPLSLTTFTDFFIQLHLPYSAVMGEQTEVKATLYNYHHQNQSVSLYLALFMKL